MLVALQLKEWLTAGGNLSFAAGGLGKEDHRLEPKWPVISFPTLPP